MLYNYHKLTINICYLQLYENKNIKKRSTIIIQWEEPCINVGRLNTIFIIYIFRWNNFKSYAKWEEISRCPQKFDAQEGKNYGRSAPFTFNGIMCPFQSEKGLIHSRRQTINWSERIRLCLTESILKDKYEWKKQYNLTATAMAFATCLKLNILNQVFCSSVF